MEWNNRSNEEKTLMCLQVVMCFEVPVIIQLNHKQLMESVDALQEFHSGSTDESFDDSIHHVSNQYCRIIRVNLMSDGTLIPSSSQTV